MSREVSASSPVQALEVLSHPFMTPTVTFHVCYILYDMEHRVRIARRSSLSTLESGPRPNPNTACPPCFANVCLEVRIMILVGTEGQGEVLYKGS